MIGRLLQMLCATQGPPTEVVEDEDGLGYFIAGHPFVEDRRPLSALPLPTRMPDTADELLLNIGKGVSGG